jgi:hypothetical protein
MAAVKTWSFREEMLLAMLRGLDHDPVPDPQEGWARCPKCHVSWYVRRRAMLADMPPGGRVIDEGIQWANPLAFSTCRS